MEMFRYVAWRAYVQRLRAGDPQPVVGAVIMWSFYVAAPLIPVMTALPNVRFNWVPDVIREHNAVTTMAAMIPIYVIGFWQFLKPGVMAQLKRAFEAEGEGKRRVRQVFLWIWPITILIVTVVVIVVV